MGGVHSPASSPSYSAGSYPGNQAVLRRLSSTTPRLQCKLTIGAVNDPLEAEADQVAEQVMRMPDPGVSVSSRPLQVSRKCAACEKEDDEVKLQTKPAGTARPVGEAPQIVHEVLRSPGQSLAPAARAFFEPRFGCDFGAVRVHSDATGAESAREVGALAYTVGRNIVLGARSPALSERSGQRLLAHELAHVVQQDGAVNRLQRQLFLAEPIELPEIDIEELLQPGEGTTFEEATPETAEAMPEESVPSPDQAQPGAEPAPGPEPAPQPGPFPVPPVPPQPDDKRKAQCGSQRLPTTVVTPTLGPAGQAGTVLASPLTICPGVPPWRGTQASRRVYPTQDACLKATPGGRNWFATHLLHGATRRPSAKQCNLHGPGNIPGNIIMAHYDINTKMSAFIERDALIRVCDLLQVLWYEARVTAYYPGNEYFAKGMTVTYGLYDTNTNSPGPQIDSQSFDSPETPPSCPGGTPAVVPPVVSTPGAADERSYRLCDALYSKPITVKEGGLRVTLHSTWYARGAAAGAECPPELNYGVDLEQEGLIFGWNKVTRVALPADKAITLTWRKLESDNYRLSLYVINPGSCCLKGNMSITPFHAPRLKRSEMVA